MHIKAWKLIKTIFMAVEYCSLWSSAEIKMNIFVLVEELLKLFIQKMKKAVTSTGESDTDSGSQAPPAGWWLSSVSK